MFKYIKLVFLICFMMSFAFGMLLAMLAVIGSLIQEIWPFGSHILLTNLGKSTLIVQFSLLSILTFKNFINLMKK